MGKKRRGGFIFITWVGDHPPRHVHVYRAQKLVVKWDLENNCAIKGRINAKLRALIDQLRSEGEL